MNNRNQKKMDTWLACAAIGIIATIIMYIIMMNQEELEAMRICMILFFVLMAFSIFSVVMTNVYNAKVKNMSAEEYLNDRFENGWKETKELFGPKNSGNSSGVSVKCPYCNSYNTSKISTMSKAIGAALIGVHALARNAKEWHCNSCGGDF